VVILNKQCFDMKSQFPFPLTTTWFQMVVALVCQFIATRVQHLFGYHQLPNLTFKTDDLKTVLPASVAFISMIGTGNLCLAYTQVSFFQIAKSLHILFSLLISTALFNEKHSTTVTFWAIMVTIGWILSTTGEPSTKFSMVGLLWGVASSLMVALYPIALKRIMGDRSMHKWNLMANNTLLSIGLLVPIILFSSEWPSVIRSEAYTSPSFWGLMCLTAVAGFMLNIAAMANVHYTTPLTHMIAGSCKGLVQTCLGIVFLGDTATVTGLLGMCWCMAAIFGYSYSRLKEQQAQENKDKKK